MESTLSVVIPSYNAAPHLSACLRALSDSPVQPLECIVIDDGSTDGTAALAHSHGVRVLSTGARRGAAHARNLGARAASGEIILFLDSDVCVHPDTLGRVLDCLGRNPDVGAVFGSYDDTPACPDPVSRYRNLLHCFVHNSGRHKASTFWTGCGAVRRHVFLRHEGFDESCALDDVEFGMRLARAHCQVRLDPRIQVQHLKKWGFVNMVRTDILHRAIPWTRLLLREGRWPNDLNLRWNSCISVAVVFVLLAIVAFPGRGALLVPGFGLIFLMTGGYWMHAMVRPAGAPRRVVFGIGLALLALGAHWEAVDWVAGAVVCAYALLFVRGRFLTRIGWMRALSGWIFALYLTFASLAMTLFMIREPAFPALCALAALLIALNLPFYLFLARRAGRLEALAAIPFHCLYYVYSGLSFLAGIGIHFWESGTRRWQSGNS